VVLRLKQMSEFQTVGRQFGNGKGFGPALEGAVRRAQGVQKACRRRAEDGAEDGAEGVHEV
jgi:hypothetical protein